MVEEDPDRTSTNANIARAEAPSVVEKLLALGACDERQLETLQVLRYTEGQRFLPHTDGFAGPVSACGFRDSGRLVTIFVYLNGVSGGSTRFNQLGIEVSPRRGMAVVHFPATTGLELDELTEHEGTPAVDEKWLLTTWIWRDLSEDARYS